MFKITREASNGRVRPFYLMCAQESLVDSLFQELSLIGECTDIKRFERPLGGSFLCGTALMELLSTTLVCLHWQHVGSNVALRGERHSIKLPLHLGHPSGTKALNISLRRSIIVH
jgi:hypothetical protein